MSLGTVLGNLQPDLLSICFMVVVEDALSQLPALYAYFHVSPAIIDSLTGTTSEDKLHELLLVMVCYHSNNK